MFGGGSGSPPKSESAIVDSASADGKPPRSPDAESEKLSSSPRSIPDADKRASAAGSTEKRGGNGNGSNVGSAGNSSPPVTGSGEQKKRRSSSSVSSRASSLLASAKNSLNFSQAGRMNSDAPSTANQTPLQKLGKQDAALAVPQGQHNNSAGDSFPGPRSTFRVGVWEDRNKKCRRTMEDTHAFLYNFLRTPAPTLAGGAASAVAEQASTKSTKSVDAASSISISTGTSTTNTNTNNNNSTTKPSSSSSNGNPSDEMLETDNGYFAIFDGHAGTFAADWCGKKLHLILEDTIRKYPNAPVPELLDQTFTSVDSQLEKLPLKNSGCTAAIAVLRWEDRVPSNQSATGSQGIAMAAAAAAAAINSEEAAAAAPATSEPAAPTSATTPTTATTISPPKAADDKDSIGIPTRSTNEGGNTSTATISSTEVAHAKLKSSSSRQRVLYTANVGDARIILCRNGKALRLSYDHKGSDENEGRRIMNAGGLILNNRVNGVLAVTRALGDTYIKDLVTGHPYTTETVIQPELDEFMIIACDGLWDVCSDQDAVNLVRDVQDPVTASKLLVDHALAHFSTDNLSCMIVRFDRDALESQKSRDSLIGVEGDEADSAARPSEADKIVSNVKQKIAEGSPAIGVSASNSGRGHEPGAHPPPGMTTTTTSTASAANATITTSSPATATTSSTAATAAPADESFKRTAIEGSVEEEPSSATSGSAESTSDGSVSTADTEDVVMESPTKS